MGLFGGSVTQVATSTQPLISEEDEVEDGLAATMIKWVMGNKDLTPLLLDSMLGGSRIKTERMLKYAEDNYPYGLANGYVAKRDANKDAMQAVLNGLEGQAVTIEYTFMDELNHIHYGWDKLTSSYGYDPDTQIIHGLSDVKGSEVYLSGIFAVVNQTYTTSSTNTLTGDTTTRRHTRPDSFELLSGATFKMRGDLKLIQLNQNKKEPSNIDAEASGFTSEGVLVVYEYTRDKVLQEEVINDSGRLVTPLQTIPENVKETLFFPISFGEDLDYHQAMYYTGLGTNKVWKCFTYEHGSGTYSSLDTNFDSRNSIYQNPGRFFPAIFFRLGKEDLRVQSHYAHDSVPHLRKMMSILGSDYDAINDSIHESDEIGKIQQAIMLYGIRGNTNDPIGIKYLFEFFEQRVLPSSVLAGERNHAYFLNTKQSTSAAYVVEDGPFSISLSMKDVFRETKTGKIAEVGECTKEISNYDYYYTWTSVQTGGHNDGDTQTHTTKIKAARLVLRKQVTSSFYVEISVNQPQTTYHVYKRYTTIGNLRENIDNLIIPMDIDIAKDMSIHEREVLYQRGMHFIFNARETEDLKWYETGIFKIVLTIITLYLVITTGQAYFIKLAAATAVGLATLAIALAEIIITTVVIQAGFKFAAEQLGPELAMALAIITMMYGGFKAFKAGSISGAPWASEMLSASTGMVDAVSSVYQNKIDAIGDEYRSFIEGTETKWEELEETEKMLDVSSPLDPFSFIGSEPATVLGEDPETFYFRTVHMGNPGSYAIDAVGHYAENSLKLPTFNDSMGDTFNG